MAETFAHRQMRESVQDVMAKRLRPRECEVLRMRFGLGGSQGQTLKQVAEILGVTRERVRQVEARTRSPLLSCKTYQVRDLQGDRARAPGCISLRLWAWQGG